MTDYEPIDEHPAVTAAHVNAGAAALHRAGLGWRDGGKMAQRVARVVLEAAAKLDRGLEAAPRPGPPVKWLGDPGRHAGQPEGTLMTPAQTAAARAAHAEAVADLKRYADYNNPVDLVRLETFMRHIEVLAGHLALALQTLGDALTPQVSTTGMLQNVTVRQPPDPTAGQPGRTPPPRLRTTL